MADRKKPENTPTDGLSVSPYLLRPLRTLTQVMEDRRSWEGRMDSARGGDRNVVNFSSREPAAESGRSDGANPSPKWSILVHSREGLLRD